MKLSVIVFVILSVATLINLCSGVFLHGNGASMRCQHRYGHLLQQATTNPNNCPHGWHENVCKVNVCYKDEGETCGSQREPNLQLKYGKCAKHLMCCEGICAKWSECVVPREIRPDFVEFVLNEKRDSGVAGEAVNQIRQQLEYEEY